MWNVSTHWHKSVNIHVLADVLILRDLIWLSRDSVSSLRTLWQDTSAFELREHVIRFFGNGMGSFNTREPPSHHQPCDVALCVLLCVPNLPLCGERKPGNHAQTKDQHVFPGTSSSSKQLRELRKQAGRHSQTTSPPILSCLYSSASKNQEVD